MSNESITISNDGKTVEHKTNEPAGQSKESSSGKVVPLPTSQLQARTDRVQVSIGEDEAGNFYDDTRHTKTQIHRETADPMQSVRTEFGQAVTNPADFKDSDSIIIEGKEMSIGVAKHLGLVKVDGSGNWSVGSIQQLTEAPDPHEGKEVVEVDFTAEHERSQINSLHEAGSPDMTNSFFHQIIGNMCADIDCDTLIADYAQKVGATADSIEAVANDVINSQFHNALTFMEKYHGVDTDKFLDYVTEKGSNHFRRQMLIGAYHNNVAMIEDVVKAYKRNELR